MFNVRRSSKSKFCPMSFSRTLRLFFIKYFAQAKDREVFPVPPLPVKIKSLLSRSSSGLKCVKPCHKQLCVSSFNFGSHFLFYVKRIMVVNYKPQLKMSVEF